MRALNLIIRREYLTRVKKKSFILLTILIPILSIALISLPIFLSEIKDSETKHIAVLDATGLYKDHLKSSEYYDFEVFDEQSEETKLRIGEDIFAILQITNDLRINPTAITILSEKQIPKDLTDYINNTVSEVIKDQKLKDITKSNSLDIELATQIKNIIDSSSKISITTLRMDKDGIEKEMSAPIAGTIGTIFTFLMYTFILMYGTMVMNGVVEEKSNRIVEVMISSVRPFDLMMGKIIGIGLTGLTQLFIWIILGVLALCLKELIPSSTDLFNLEYIISSLNLVSSVNWIEILIYFIVLFIGGYLIYASIFAMFGASVDNPQDTQQFVMPITIIFMFALYAGIYSVQNPDGPLAFWCSMIPLTSPIVMMVRIPFEIPLWEKLLSLVILYTTIYFVVKFASKIYRVGILMYGKKPTVKEILKWFAYK